MTFVDDAKLGGINNTEEDLNILEEDVDGLEE